METLITWITAIVAAASVIANVTPSMRDNEILAKVDDFIQTLAINLRKKDQHYVSANHARSKAPNRHT